MEMEQDDDERLRIRRNNERRKKCGHREGVWRKPGQADNDDNELGE